MMSNIDENFAYRVKKFGPPENALPLTEKQSSRLEGSLPASLVGFLRAYGIGSYFNGLYRMCDPADFRSILALVFKADKDFDHRDCHVVAYTAFGELHCWSERYWDFKIDLPAGMIFSQTLAPTLFKDMPTTQPSAKADANRMASSLIPLNADDVDYSDFEDEPMFERCVEKYGKPAPDECFGFFPALALAGVFGKTRTVEHIKRVKALEHFAILAQLDTFFLTKVGPEGFEAVRPIG